MTYFSKSNYTIIRKHWIVLIFRYLKSLLYIIIALILLYVSIKYWEYLWKEVVYYLFFPIIFFLVNYWFIKLILWYIKFYNNLLIINNWKLIVINATLLLKDDIEFIDIKQVTKIDTFVRGALSNIIWYWDLVVEQQRDQVRIFHNISNPRKALHIINDEKDNISKNNNK